MNWKSLLIVSLLALPLISLSFAQEDDVKRHVEVRVELNNESTLEGIVVDGKFYEKYNTKRNRWQVMPSRKGAGLRLYHVEKAEGFIYLNYETDIKRIEEIGKKSESELRALRKEIQERLEAERIAYEQKIIERQAAQSKDEKGEDGEGTEESGEESSTNSDGLSPETLKKYEDLLEKYNPAKFSLAKTLQAVKIRMISGIPLGKYKDFLLNYETWRKAKDHKDGKKPKEDYTDQELLEARRLMASYPKEKYDLTKKVNKFSINALNEIPMDPKDAEWLALLDKWLDAQHVIKLDEKKQAAEATESESSEE